MIDFRRHTNRILNHAKKNFGEPCTLYPQSGGSISIIGIFDNAHQFVDAETEQPVSTTHPTLGVNLFDFKCEIKQGDHVKVRNVTFKIIDTPEDGQGGATLVLHQVNHEQKVFKKKSH